MGVETSAAWQALQLHCDSGMGAMHLSSLFGEANRVDRFSLELDELYIDFSKNRITEETLSLLQALAEQQGLKHEIERLLVGEEVNDTEERPALHSALRAQGQDVSGVAEQVQGDVEAVLQKMTQMVDKIRAGHWRGYSGKPITDVVNIGVGGSDLGPLMITHSLQTVHSPVNLHFISSIDGTQTSNLLRGLNQETTLFILASKSFTTIDTLSNAETAKDWLRECIKSDDVIHAQHFIGVSTKPDKMTEWGIPPENQLLFWDWVGGRYSLWSAIGFPIALKIGMPGFRELLQGAHLMDQHFATAPLSENIPVVLGLIDIWNINFLNIHDKAILPYDARLKYLPSYLEQLVMESNGKSVAKSGDSVAYKTCPVLWGEVGPNAQHAFYQLLHQGTQAVMCDFIAPVERDDFDATSHAEKDESLRHQHELALANCFAQSRVLMLGDGAIPDNLKSSFDSPFKHYPGNQPSNTILMKTISAKTLGMLVAMYEHKTYVEGVMWGINSFDQWGVELGKLIAKETYSAIKEKTLAERFDSSTKALIDRVAK
ncbi:glucose-6-phosphate isomerase [Hydrogenovibrio thermophilus]|uniref:Glucose-6-phosphate isomerase n=1 Tax=Hydrogenovibrio thermophilus TaxID=265883 RepID=A0A410H1P5_9GAMM|nr:glucose-6-phosphate isomerase [Hydrogenovibrio thermophilus]QAB14838.1 glucose-6-phosphate isomerase [Hydrogenovibrio thermophilus]